MHTRPEERGIHYEITNLQKREIKSKLNANMAH